MDMKNVKMSHRTMTLEGEINLTPPTWVKVVLK